MKVMDIEESTLRFVLINSYSANRGDIHCALALTAARAAMHKLICQC